MQFFSYQWDEAKFEALYMQDVIVIVQTYLPHILKIIYPKVCV